VTTLYASADDVAAELLRDLTAPEAALVALLLPRATLLIEQQFTDLPDRIAAGTLNVELVRGVVAGMVARRLRNPNGAQSWSLDDYTERYGENGSRAGLYLSAEDLDILAAPTAATNAFTIRPSYTAPAPRTCWPY
jgi:hypothetical protein